MTPATKPSSAHTDVVVRWLLGLFAALIVVLVSENFSGVAEAKAANTKQDIALLRIQISDSIETARLTRIETKVDSILTLVRRYHP